MFNLLQDVVVISWSTTGSLRREAPWMDLGGHFIGGAYVPDLFGHTRHLTRFLDILDFLSSSSELLDT